MSARRSQSQGNDPKRSHDQHYERARLLALSGQTDAARDVLEAILATDPADRRAAALLARLGGTAGGRRRGPWRPFARLPASWRRRAEAAGTGVRAWLAVRRQRFRNWTRLVAREWTRLRRWCADRGWRRWPGFIAEAGADLRKTCAEIRRDWIRGRPAAREARRRCRRYLLLNTVRWAMGRTRRRARQPGWISKWLRRPNGLSSWERLSTAVVGGIIAIDLARFLATALKHGWDLEIAVRGRSSSSMQPVSVAVLGHLVLILFMTLLATYGLLHKKEPTAE